MFFEKIKDNPKGVTSKLTIRVLGSLLTPMALVGLLSPILILVGLCLLPSVLMFWAGLVNPKNFPEQIYFHRYLLVSLVLSAIYVPIYIVWLFLNGAYFSF